MNLTVNRLRFASALAGVVPTGIARPLARLSGSVIARISADQRFVVERNLRRVYGPDLDTAQLPALVRDVFANYALYWLESLRVPRLSAEDLDLGLTYEGLEHVMGPLREGQGVIAAIPHMGSWEAGARWLAEVQDLRVVAAVEKLDPPELYEWFLEYRTRDLGIEVVAAGPGGAGQLASALGEGAILTLLCDRDLSGNGIEVDFFGERTTLPAGPAMLALRTGAPLVPLAVLQRDGRHHGLVLGPVPAERRGRLRDDLARVTQDLAYALEHLIRVDPTQWHVLQPNWPADVRALAERSKGTGSTGSASTGSGSGNHTLSQTPADSA